MGWRGVVAAVGLVGLLGTCSYSRFISDTITTRVVDTTVKRYGDKDKYLIMTEDGTFENTDAWYRWKWDSSDVQGKASANKGKRVEIEKYGWRLGFMSWYENVVGIQPIAEPVAPSPPHAYQSPSAPFPQAPAPGGGGAM